MRIEINRVNKKIAVLVTVFLLQGVLCCCASDGHLQDTTLVRPVEEVYPNGNLMLKGYFKNGAPVGALVRFFETGELERVVSYSEGEIHGRMIAYHKTGQVRFEEWWNKGSRSGSRYDYYESGALKSSCKLVNGTVVGEIQWFDEQGQRVTGPIYD